MYCTQKKLIPNVKNRIIRAILVIIHFHRWRWFSSSSSDLFDDHHKRISSVDVWGKKLTPNNQLQFAV